MAARMCFGFRASMPATTPTAARKIMSYLDKILQPDEKILTTGRKHWIIYAPAAACLVLAVLIAIAGSGTPHLGLIAWIAALLLGAFGLVLLLREWFEQWTTEIVVTDRRVVYKTGFISRKTT